MKSCVTSNPVHQCWEVAGQLSEETDQQFEIHKSLHPTISEDDMLICTCQSYNVRVNNLIPDRVYQFSVKRVDAANLVHEVWIDSITLRTWDISNLEQNVPSQTF